MRLTWFETLNHWLAPENWLSDGETTAKSEESLAEIIDLAHRDWLSTQTYYNNISDPDLLDHAIYQMQAAEKRYNYLLKLAREEGLVQLPFPIEINR